MRLLTKGLVILGVMFLCVRSTSAQETLWQGMVAQYQHSFQQGFFIEAGEIAEGALWVAEENFPAQDLHIPESLELIAQSYVAQNHHTKARKLYTRILALREAVLGPHHPSVATTLFQLAKAYIAEGQPELAEHLFRRALAIREALLSSKDPERVSTLITVGNYYVSQNKPEEAEELYLRVLSLRQEEYGQQDPIVATTLILLADFYIEQGNLSEAETYYKSAISTREVVLGSDHLSVATASILLAKFYVSTGREFQAKQSFARALRVLNQSFNIVSEEENILSSEIIKKVPAKITGVSGSRQTTAQIAESLKNQAIAYMELGESRQASLFFEQSLNAYEKVFRSEDPEFAALLDEYAVMMRMLKNYERASSLEARAQKLRSLQ